MIKKNIKLIVSAIIVICIVVTCLIYTRPQTIEQRYPLLSISDCTGMKGYYFVAPGVEDTAFQISSDDSRFSELIQQLQSVQIKKKLSNILPQGTKTHRLYDGDFKWELMLHFDDVSHPSGSHGSGYMLHIRNFFGDVSISFDGEEIWYSVSNQEQWLRDVLDIILQGN